MHSLSKISIKAQAEYQQNARAVVIMPKVVGNHAKLEILHMLFQVYVKTNKVINGCQKSTVKFWLASHFKTLT